MGIVRKYPMITLFTFIIITIIVCIFVTNFSNMISLLRIMDPDISNAVNGTDFYETVRYPTIMWWYSFRTQKISANINCYTRICQVVSLYSLGRENDRLIDGILFFGYDTYFLPLPKRPDMIWMILHYESSKCNPILTNKKDFKMFNYSSTFSLQSDVPLPLHSFLSWGSVTALSIPPDIKTSYKYAPILYMQRDCTDISGRHSFVQELIKYIPIDCYGSCLTNKATPIECLSGYHKNEYDLGILDLLRNYKFAIAIENAVCEDYITEKLWRAIVAGVVPIYFGSPSIRDWLPNEKSAILIEDFPTPRLLSEHLYSLLANEKLYKQHLEHKTIGMIRNHRLFYEYEIKMSYLSYRYIHQRKFIDIECYLCHKLHDIREGKPVKSVISEDVYKCRPPTSTLFGKKSKHIYPNKLTVGDCDTD